MMKKLLFHALTCCAVLLPLSQVEAKPFGDLSPGDTFVFKVKSRISKSQTGLNPRKNCPVPSGIPNLRVGDTVKFTIGHNGQLTFRSTALPFTGVDGNVNEYRIPRSFSKPVGDFGFVFKDGSDVPKKVSLSFSKFTISGFSGTGYFVSYILE